MHCAISIICSSVRVGAHGRWVVVIVDQPWMGCLSWNSFGSLFGKNLIVLIATDLLTWLLHKLACMILEDINHSSSFSLKGKLADILVLLEIRMSEQFQRDITRGSVSPYVDRYQMDLLVHSSAWMWQFHLLGFVRLFCLHIPFSFC